MNQNTDKSHCFDIFLSNLTFNKVFIMANNVAHIIMQKKGGAGKTTVSVLLADYLRNNEKLGGRQLRLYDTDPTNKSFKQFNSLNVEHVDILDENGDIDKSKFDVIINSFLEGSHDILVDTGSSNFIQLHSFLELNEIAQVAHAYNKQVVIHVPILFDGSYTDTCESLAQVADSFEHANIIVWANTGSTMPSQVIDITQTPYYQNKLNILGVVTIPYMDATTTRADFTKLMNSRQIFEDIATNIGTGDWTLLQKIRLEKVRDSIAKDLNPRLELVYGLTDVAVEDGADVQENDGNILTTNFEPNTATPSSQG